MIEWNINKIFWYMLIIGMINCGCISTKINKQSGYYVENNFKSSLENYFDCSDRAKKINLKDVRLPCVTVNETKNETKINNCQTVFTTVKPGEKHSQTKKTIAEFTKRMCTKKSIIQENSDKDKECNMETEENKKKRIRPSLNAKLTTIRTSLPNRKINKNKLNYSKLHNSTIIDSISKFLVNHLPTVIKEINNCTNSTNKLNKLTITPEVKNIIQDLKSLTSNKEATNILLNKFKDITYQIFNNSSDVNKRDIKLWQEIRPTSKGIQKLTSVYLISGITTTSEHENQSTNQARLNTKLRIKEEIPKLIENSNITTSSQTNHKELNNNNKHKFFINYKQNKQNKNNILKSNKRNYDNKEMNFIDLLRTEEEKTNLRYVPDYDENKCLLKSLLENLIRNVESDDLEKKRRCKTENQEKPENGNLEEINSNLAAEHQIDLITENNTFYEFTTERLLKMNLNNDGNKVQILNFTQVFNLYSKLIPIKKYLDLLSEKKPYVLNKTLRDFHKFPNECRPRWSTLNNKKENLAKLHTNEIQNKLLTELFNNNLKKLTDSSKRIQTY